MERPNNVPQYDDIDLKLGIKSSLPNVKETLALFLLMWRSCGKASVLDYCVSDGNNLKVEPNRTDRRIKTTTCVANKIRRKLV